MYLPFPFPGLRLLQAVAPEGTSVEPDGDAFVFRWPGGHLRASALPMQQLGPHLRGMVGYLDEQGATSAERVRAMHSQGVLGLVAEPGVQEPTAWQVILGLVGISDGLLFVNGDFYTRDGVRLLADGLQAPGAERVARRALILLALATRGLLDEDAGKPDEADAEELRNEIWQWLGRHDLHAEAEPLEAELLQAPIGTAPQQRVVDAVWRAEGAQVLLWALGQRPLPDHDAQEHPYQVSKEAGLRAEAEPAVLQHPTLRAPEELEAKRLQLQGLSWRFTDHRLNPRAFDYRSFAARAPMGRFSLDGVTLAGDDLALRGAAIHEAAPELVGLCSSIARERHIAANWLIGVNPVYSNVDAPT